MPPRQYPLEDDGEADVVGEIGEVELIGDAQVKQIGEHWDDTAEPGESGKNPEKNHHAVHVEYALYFGWPFGLDIVDNVNN